MTTESKIDQLKDKASELGDDLKLKAKEVLSLKVKKHSMVQSIKLKS